MIRLGNTLTIILAVLSLTILLSEPASAKIYTFQTLNNPVQGENMKVDVVDMGDHIDFNFSSSVTDGSHITAIYWDFGNHRDSGLFIGIDVGSGTGFPDDVPRGAGSNIPDSQLVAFSADRAIKAAYGQGLSTGEQLSLSWITGSYALDYDSLIADLDSRKARVALIVKNLPGGLTASAVTGELTPYSYTPTATPIPGAVWLLGSGLVGLIGLRHRMAS